MNETVSNDYLEKERISKLMWKYAIPCVISMLVAAIAIAVMIGDGCCTFVSIRLGAKERDGDRKSVV